MGNTASFGLYLIAWVGDGLLKVARDAPSVVDEDVGDDVDVDGVGADLVEGNGAY